MECNQMDQAVDREWHRSGEALSVEARQHLTVCARCRALHDWLASETTAEEISSSLRTRITGSLVGSLVSVRPIPVQGTSFLQMILLFAAIVVVMVGMMGTSGLARMTALQIFGVSAVLVTGLCLGSLSLSWQMRPGSLQRISARIAIASFGLGFLTGVALLFPWHSEPAFVKEGWPCLAAGLGVAAPSALLLWLIVRRGAALSIKTMGATLGATAGIFGLTVLQYKCPHQEALHLLVWHGGVLVMMTVAGILIASMVGKIFRLTVTAESRRAK